MRFPDEKKVVTLQTDRPTDGPTDRPSYRDAWTHLNKLLLLLLLYPQASEIDALECSSDHGGGSGGSGGGGGFVGTRDEKEGSVTRKSMTATRFFHMSRMTRIVGLASQYNKWGREWRLKGLSGHSAE